MSSETDNPRQRTVAELLAEHGDTGATGRRRRRREADEPDHDVAAPEAAGPGPVIPGGSRTPGWRGAPLEPDRAVPHDQVPAARQQSDRAPMSWEPRRREVPPADGPSRETLFREAPPADGPSREALFQEAPSREAPSRELPLRTREPRGFAPEPGPARSVPPAPRGAELLPGNRPPMDPARDRATDQMPRIRDDAFADPDPEPTGPIQHQRLDDRVREDSDIDAAGAGDLDEPGDTADQESDQDASEGGPATMVGAPPVGAESWNRAHTSGKRASAVEAGPPTQAATPLDFDDFDDHPAGLDSADDDDDADDDADAAAAGASAARSDRASGSAGQAWMVVLTQWIVGAIGGAALWVGFRFLWRSLPVVALAAAVLVTVGLVVVVRALLRNDDTRTTVFAVLVGLLLTVSPAILVLLGR